MGFEQCHPAVIFIYFAAVITGMVAFQNPIFLAIGFLCAVAYSVKRGGRRAAIFDLALLPLVAAFALYYSSYNHFGMTVLKKNMIDNAMTLESLVYGLVLGITAAGVCVWFSCVHSVVTGDQVVYLLGRASPRLSLFLAIALRMVPRIKKQMKKIEIAQRGIGRGAGQGGLVRRLRNGIRILSMLITWMIEAMTTASVSMRSRGSGLRGRCAFSIYRFDNRDRAYVVAMFACLTLTLMGVILGQTDAVYDPRILLPTPTPISYLFFGGYAMLCLMPLLLELWADHRFRSARRRL
ncbi:MAG: energy-coupling factor transporter transmembrane protein EcfT [Oscillospiraceae bacterium]|nr:energy-coupling factor transporter transmembrane protein EcfT [Oscillospiraceae bacterium]